MCCIGGEVILFPVDSFRIKRNQIRLGETSWVSWLQMWGGSQKKSTGQVTWKLIPWHGNSSEMRWDMINLVGYRVLMTYYYMPFFGRLVHITYSILLLVCVCMYPLKIYVFSEKRKRTRHQLRLFERWSSLSKCLCCSFLKIIYPEQLQSW